MMKIDFIKAKKTFRKNSILPDPNFYWTILFSIGLGLTVLALVFGLYMFTKVSSEDSLSPEGNNPELAKISRDRILNILQAFNERKNTSEEILNSPSPLSDPSI